MDKALLVEGVALIVIGVIAASLFIALSLRVLGAYAPLQGSVLPENPSYLELYYNITGALPTTSGQLEVGWVLAIVRVSEESPSYTITSLAINGSGGSPAVVSELSMLAGQSQPGYELEQPFINSPYIMSEYPSRVIYLGGSPYSASVETVNYTAFGIEFNETLYYRLSDGVLLKGTVDEYNATSGALLAQLNYTLVREQVLSPFVPVPTPVNKGLLYASFGILAAVAGVGIVVGGDRLVKSAS